MSDLEDGESTTVHGSGSSIYTLKNIAGVYSCTCPAWMHQSVAIEKRTCKHIRAYRGDDAERGRLGAGELTGKPARAASDGEAEADGPPLLLAHKWESDVDLTGWWMSEKLDGVRAYWDGKQLVSRLGNAFFPPDWFIAGLPDTPLDGELWGGRKKFQRTVGIVKRQDKSEAWREIRYVVFDAPKHGGFFEERLAHLEAALGGGKSPWASVHPHELVRDLAHVKEELARVEGLGGEGLMMRKPKSKYEIGRSSTLLKVKTFHDAEARVLEHVAGAGRHKGRLGALLVELPDGTRFNVGTGFSDAEREEPPPVGAIINFRYQELSDGGVPRFPSYVGVRHDFRWPGKPAPASERERRIEEKLAKGFVEGKDRQMARYELVEGTSSKFWEIRLDGDSFTTTYGRIGAEGQTTTKDFDSPDKAKKEYEKLVAEKVKKGYKLAGGKRAPAAAIFDDEGDDEEEAKPAPKRAAAGASKAGKSGARYFEFSDGASHKFWEIRLDGTSFTTRFGRIGTSGQESAKDYDSADKAKKEYDKLVAEKVKKGYAEK